RGKKRDYGTVGRSIDVHLMVLLSRRKYQAAYSWLSVAYNLGIPLEAVQPESLVKIRKAGVFRERQRERPWDYAAPVWRGMGAALGTDSTTTEKEYERRKADLLTALKDDQMSSLYRSVTNTTLAIYYFYSCKDPADIPKTRRICLSLIEEAKKDHPEPDKRLGYKYLFLTWGRPINAKSGRQMLALLKESERWLTERYQRTVDGRLTEGRPLKSPLHSVDRSYRERLSSVIFSQARVYESLGERAKALKILKEGASKYPNPALYEFWLSLLGENRPSSVYAGIRASVERWRSDRRTKGEAQDRLNAIFKRIPR
ncbi:MAG: hypothetical protein P1V97_38430, partial [Planctomycetota bacterium]|nr:hypothetical protein [Planctomycetota bacterium]